jgi:glutathione S-transferase
MKVVEAMRAAGVKKFGVMGFCYGGWLGFHLSKEIPGSEFVCGATTHPSVHIEGMTGGNPAELAGKCQCPWALFPCGKPSEGGDPDIYDLEGGVYKALEEKMPGQNMTKRLEGMFHGFFVRGAIEEGHFGADHLPRDEVRKAVMETMADVEEFFIKHGLLNKLEKPSADVKTGMRLHVKWGEVYYAAQVKEVSTSRRRAKTPFKVHFDGYDESEDAWVGEGDLKCKKLGLPKKQDAKAAADKKPRKKAPKIKLTYFDIEGVVEKVRLALVLGGIEFEDDRIAFDKWPEIKPTTKNGQLPMMQIGDSEPFAQSGAMLRYAGRLARLYPPSTLLKIEEAIGLEEDMGKTISPSMYIGMRPHVYGHPEDMDKEKKSEIQLALRKKVFSEEGDMTKFLKSAEAFLGDNPFLTGKNPTIADCQMIPRLTHLKSGILDGVPKTVLDAYPKLSAYYDRFMAIPNVKAWYEKRAAAKK